MRPIFYTRVISIVCKKNDSCVINEHSEPVFNAAAATQIGFQSPATFNLSYKQIILLPLLIVFLLLEGCKTVPIQNRDVSESGGGFWELDANTDPRFHHRAVADKEMIGVLYASGDNTLLNGAKVEISTGMNNNALVSTGPRSSARIEFKEANGTCLIHVNEFHIGNAYADASRCQHRIETAHGDISAHDATYHVNVSQQQIILTVLKGIVKIGLRTGIHPPASVNGGEEVTLRADVMTGPHPVTPEEIMRRIDWRNNYQFHRSEVDWTKVLIGVGAAGAVAAGVVLHDKGKHRGGGGPTTGGSGDSLPTGPAPAAAAEPKIPGVPASSVDPKTYVPPVRAIVPKVPDVPVAPVDPKIPGVSVSPRIDRVVPSVRDVIKAPPPPPAPVIR